MVRTTWERIDKNPTCDRCGNLATYKFKRKEFLRHFENNYCDKCLKLIRTYFHV